MRHHSIFIIFLVQSKTVHILLRMIKKKIQAESSFVLDFRLMLWQFVGACVSAREYLCACARALLNSPARDGTCANGIGRVVATPPRSDTYGQVRNNRPAQTCYYLNSGRDHVEGLRWSGVDQLLINHCGCHQ